MKSMYSMEYESEYLLKRYRDQLKTINELNDFYRNKTDEELKKYINFYKKNFDKEQDVEDVFAITREVTYRLLGKRQYDVQVLGGLAALERNMIQMSTGSGKTITLILPAVVFGYIKKGCNVLTVNDYLSKRDWEETKPVYDFMGITSAYVNNDMTIDEQKQAFACDITYSTNSTLGFAYLNSSLASDITIDKKVITRPLYAAIIDEADEILLDDARNPLIIASNVSSEQLDFEYNGKTWNTAEILERLRKLKNLAFDFDEGRNMFLGDDAWNEIQRCLNVDDDIFSSPEMLYTINNCIVALFKYKLYTDYVVTDTPDQNSGSRITLIDKATGRLAYGRTLTDGLHTYIEIKEGVYSGISSQATLQITYQMLFNLFETIAGVTGTLGTSYQEFIHVYNTGIVVIPDRQPNLLKEKTHLYITKNDLYDDLLYKIRVYSSSRHPILIGCTSDIHAEYVSNVLTTHDIKHKKLISIDTCEEIVVESAGKIGSIVVTTDIMGRGTDIKIEDTNGDRGLVVFQVDGRHSSRVERQFAGRAARQGEPGRFHRLICLPELRDLGVSQRSLSKITERLRDYTYEINKYRGDILMNGYAEYYTEVVKIINEALEGKESTESQSRIQSFKTLKVIELIQIEKTHKMDEYRYALKQSVENKEHELLYEIYDSLDVDITNKDITLLQETLFNYVQRIMTQFLPELRLCAEDALKTISFCGLTKYDSKPEILMHKLIHDYINKYDFSIQVTV